MPSGLWCLEGRSRVEMCHACHACSGHTCGALKQRDSAFLDGSVQRLHKAVLDRVGLIWEVWELAHLSIILCPFGHICCLRQGSWPNGCRTATRRRSRVQRTKEGVGWRRSLTLGTARRCVPVWLYNIRCSVPCLPVVCQPPPPLLGWAQIL